MRLEDCRRNSLSVSLDGSCGHLLFQRGCPSPVRFSRPGSVHGEVTRSRQGKDAGSEGGWERTHP